MSKLIISTSSGGGADLDVITATAADVVAPKVIVNKDGEPEIGTIPLISHGDKGEDAGINTSGLYYHIAPGYRKKNPNTDESPWVYMPLEKVATALGLTTAKILSGQSACGVVGTATNDAFLDPAYLAEGYSGYDDGVKKKGTMPIRNAWNGRIGVNGKVMIPHGYHNGAGYVDQAISNRGSLAKTLAINETFWLQEGYYSGGYVNQGIPTQGELAYTPNKATQTAWLSGKYMTGNVIIHPIPANYVDTSVGSVVF